MCRKVAVALFVVLVVVLALPAAARPVQAEIICKDPYEPNDQAGRATPIVIGGMPAAICPAGDVDLYKIDVSAGEKLTFTVGYPRSDFNLYVYSAKRGVQLGRSELPGSAPDAVTLTADRSETYYVLVQGAGGTGLYILVTESSRRRMTPLFRVPVSGVGEGITTPIGSDKHKGADQYALDYQWSEAGVDVYPIYQGRVVYSGCSWADYGCTVVVRHWDDKLLDKKYYSIYAHLQEGSLPPLWSLVDANRPLGRMGKTGNGSNGIVHLHFAVRTSDQVYDGTNALYGVGMTAFDVRPRFY